MTTLVVGVDGSPASRHTLRFALEEARRWGARLRIVHAFWEYDPVPGSDEVEADRGRPEREEWLAGFVRDVVGEVTDVGITETIVEDDPGPALLAAAANAELLIVGSHGHGGFTDLLLGSVSRHCAHHAPCPIVIVRPTGRLPDDRG